MDEPVIRPSRAIRAVSDRPGPLPDEVDATGEDEPPSQSATSLEGLVTYPTPLTPRKKLPSISPRARAFRKAFFGEATERQWNDWTWQIQNRVRSLDGLARILVLSDSEREAIARDGAMLPTGITPYYMSLLDREDAGQPLRRTVIPTMDEYVHAPGESVDPLSEDEDSPVPGIVHRYPDRVLFLVTDFCTTYCRFCTRSRLVGHCLTPTGRARWEKALAYIRGNPVVRDVVLSGGDPLSLSTENLDWLLSRVREIPHVEIVRLGTKVPAVLPQRVTPELVWMLRKHHPLYMSLHFTHPDECTPEAAVACRRLADAGIPLGSQTVLLRGVNDDVDTMRRLMQRLLAMRVRPYYLYQCDPILGSSHFRTSVERGLAIVRGLRGFTSGYAVPHYVIDAPGGGGKIPLLPEYYVGREGDHVVLRNYEGKTFRYPDPVSA